MKMLVCTAGPSEDYNSSFLLHPGLLWKECRQHRLLFILFFLLVVHQPLLPPLLVRLFSLSAESLVEPGFNPWIIGIKNLIQPGTSTMEVIAALGVVLLAALMVAGERGGSLNYLATAPVNRRQILMAKWMTGSLVILLVMALLFIYTYVISVLNPEDLAVSQLAFWAGKTAASLLCLFSLVMLSASLCTGVIYSMICTGFFLALPLMISGMVLVPLYKYRILAAGEVGQAFNRVLHWNIVNVIMGESPYAWNDPVQFIVMVLFLLLLSFIFLFLALRAFAANPLTRSGEVLLRGSFKEIGRLILACFFAPLVATELAASVYWFAAYTVLLFAGIYLGIGILWHAMAWLGLLKTSSA
jgi:ABC-type transport system involved in multi-copper enzyme maturation permease subunit